MHRNLIKIFHLKAQCEFEQCSGFILIWTLFILTNIFVNSCNDNNKKGTNQQNGKDCNELFQQHWPKRYVFKDKLNCVSITKYGNLN